MMAKASSKSRPGKSSPKQPAAKPPRLADNVLTGPAIRPLGDDDDTIIIKHPK